MKLREPGQKWSTLKFSKEKPTASDFNLWRQAVLQLVPAGGLAVRLGRRLHEGYKIWDWRVNSEEGYLLHYRDGVMDVYERAPFSRRRWQLCKANCEESTLGEPCSVREMGAGQFVITSESPSVDVPIEPTTILEVLQSWKQTWFWRSFQIVGDLDWVIRAIERGSLLTVADGSYMRQLFVDACSCAYVFECQEGEGRILGKFAEGSKDACAYRGELLGLLAIHLILLAVKKLRPDLKGRVRIVSDCLGALR